MASHSARFAFRTDGRSRLAVKRQRAVRPYRLQRRHDQSRNGGGRIGPEFGPTPRTDPHGLRPHVACRRRLGPDDCRRRRLRRSEHRQRSGRIQHSVWAGHVQLHEAEPKRRCRQVSAPRRAQPVGRSKSPWMSSGPTPSSCASIILVETNSDNLNDLLTGVNTARNLSGVSVVSMSWVPPRARWAT